MNADILMQDVQDLLEKFSRNRYTASESIFGNDVMQKCLVLMQFDYSVLELPNSNSLGELSPQYPANILIPEFERHNINNRQQQTIYESTYDASKLRELISKARFARCRNRFPLPIILYKGKYICRSATISGTPEIYMRSNIDYLFSGDNNATIKSPNLDEDAYEAQENLTDDIENLQLLDRVRYLDIKLLKTFNIGSIVDLMLEKKKVKFLVNVTSSEKVDKEKRYQDFKIISLPYPGCEFFKDFRDNNYSGEGLVFDWSQKSVDAEIGVPLDNVSSQLNINFDKYKDWDLIQITQNYMRLLLKYIQESSSGLLIHCISGWDRTPAFCSLLRLSLWADGLIHQSLSAIQILYFTIAYDWFLFGHNLPDRLQKGEDIFFFCFYVLKYLMDDEFSIAGQRKQSGSSGSSSIGIIRTDSSDVFDGTFDGDSRGSSVSLNSTCSSRSHQDPNLTASSNGLHDDSNANGWLQNQEGLSDNGTSVLNISPQLQRRTSPMQVPRISHANHSDNRIPRQRQESSSSVSVGSWQMISGTGSLRSQDSNILVINEFHQQQQHQLQQQQQSHNLNISHPLQQPTSSSSHPSANMCSNYQSSGGGGVSNNDASTILVEDDCFTANDYFLRRERLNAVRTLFYNCYASTIGYNFKNGNESAGLGSLLGNFAERVGLTTQKTPV